MKRKPWLIALALTYPLSLQPAMAEDDKNKVVLIDVMGCVTAELQVLPYSSQYSAGTVSASATMRSNIPNSSFDANAYQCLGSWAALGGEFQQQAICQGLTPSGEKWLVQIRDNGQKGKWEMVDATGPLKGASGGGEYIRIIQFPQLKPTQTQFCHRITGSITRP